MSYLIPTATGQPITGARTVLAVPRAERMPRTERPREGPGDFREELFLFEAAAGMVSLLPLQRWSSNTLCARVSAPSADTSSALGLACGVCKGACGCRRCWKIWSHHRVREAPG